MLLRACYAVSGTNRAYALLSAYALATPCPVLIQALLLLGKWRATITTSSGTSYQVGYQPTRLLRHVRC